MDGSAQEHREVSGNRIGDNASIHMGNVYHSLPPSSEAPPQPRPLIPFSRDSDFIHRGDILEQIDQTCLEPAGRVALVGLGGVGKSQLAIEYAHQFANAFNDAWVFWIHASNQARVEEGFRTIADALRLAGRSESGADIANLVQNWLANERNGRWLLVLDSADDLDVFFGARQGAHARPFATYLPQSTNGAILITTRNRDLAMKLIKNDQYLIEIGTMVPDEALTLLGKKLNSLYEKRVALDLVEALDFVPLAINQAAAYIRKNEPRSSVEKYLLEFRKSNREKIRLLEQDGGDIRRDGAASNAILKTWKLSFDQIRATRPSATDLLSLMSFFDRQGIPKWVLRPLNKSRTRARTINTEGSDDPTSEASDGFSDSDISDDTSGSFDDDIMMLRDYCLISLNENGDEFEMHRLVQLSTKGWLRLSGRQEKPKQKFIETLAASFPTGEYETWAICRRLFPHAQLALDYRPDENQVLHWGTLLLNGGWYAFLRGEYGIAERMLSKSRQSLQKRLGREDVIVLSSTSKYARIVLERGQWEEAEKLFVKVMEIRKTKFGEDHPDTLRSMDDLASTYSKQGRWGDAEVLSIQVMEISKTKFGADHPSTLASMANLALAYGNQGRWDDAEKLLVQVMEARKALLGEDHPDTLTSIANLALIFWDQGRWDDAEKLLMQVMEARKAVLGEDHPDTLMSIANLAVIFWNQGRWYDSEKLLVQVMEARKATLGEDHPDTLMSMVNLALTFQNQGRWDAEKLMVQVMEMIKINLGEDYTDTPLSMNNLATTWKSMGKSLDAMEIIDQRVGFRHLGPRMRYPDAAFTSSNLDQLDGHQSPKIERPYSPLSAESSYLPGESHSDSTNITAPSHGITFNRQQSHEGPIPMSFFNFQKSKVESLHDRLPDDLQSIESLKEEIQSLDGSQSHITTAAVDYIAPTLINDPDLFGMYHEAIQRMNQAKFIRNHRRLLKGFYLGLRAEEHTAQQKLAVDFLRLRGSRLRISHEIHSRLKTWDGTTPEKITTTLEQKQDNLFLLDRFLERGSEVQPTPMNMDSNVGATTPDHGDVVSEMSEDSEDHRELEEKTIGESPNLTAIAEFLISGQSFNSYKDNLRRFLHTSPKVTGNVGCDEMDMKHPRDQKQDNSSYGAFFLKVLNRIELWRRPVVQSGYKRVTWTSACGKSLYVDVGGASQQQAEALQSRFRQATISAQPGERFSASNIAHPPTVPAPAYSLATNVASVQPRSSAEASSELHSAAPLLQSQSGFNGHDHEELRPRYLLLCITTRQSVSYHPIDVTHVTHDQFLFQAIRDEYFYNKSTKSWALRLEAAFRLPAYVRLCFESLEVFTPRRAELVSFFLMPVPKGQADAVSPFGFQLSYPPEDEVRARRWEYNPCPKSFNYFQMDEAFVTTMLKPGHAYRDDAWLQLFPKKLNSKLGYERRGYNSGWGIHIVEGFNIFGIVRLAFLIVLGSGIVGIIYSSISRDPGTGFTIAAWLGTVASLLVASIQLSIY